MRGRWAAFGLVICWFCAGILAADPPPATSPEAKPAPGATPDADKKPDARAAAGEKPKGTSIIIGPHRSYWYGYPPWDSWCPPYPPYWYYPPPMFVPAEALYGPQAVKRFLGVQDSNPAPRTTITWPGPAMVAPLPGQAPLEPKKPPEAVPRAANAETRALARRFIGFGDQHFTNEKYGEAYQRYRKAAEVMPELAEAYFRQGFALIGAGRYDLAAKVIKRGLALDPGWPKSGFRLNELYGGNQGAKAAHLEALAAAAEKSPDNADLLFLLGVCLFFDGARDRAAPFFERAVQLAGPGEHLLGFLEPVRK